MPSTKPLAGFPLFFQTAPKQIGAHESNSFAGFQKFRQNNETNSYPPLGFPTKTNNSFPPPNKRGTAVFFPALRGALLDGHPHDPRHRLHAELLHCLPFRSIPAGCTMGSPALSASQTRNGSDWWPFGGFTPKGTLKKEPFGFIPFWCNKHCWKQGASGQEKLTFI